LRGRWHRALLAVILLVVPYVAASEPLAIGLVRASLGFDQRTGDPIVNFVMTPASGRAFADLTGKNVGKPTEFRVDGRVVMKPVIREPILGGSVQISGSFSADEARALAERLSSGAGKFEVEVVE
jgi:preprotein translocase subunit SecD